MESKLKKARLESGPPTKSDRPEHQGPVMADLLQKPRVMYIGQFPGCKMTAQKWKSRLENLRVDEKTFGIQGEQYGELPVKTVPLSRLVPEIYNLQMGIDSAFVRIEDPETNELQQWLNLELFDRAVKRWFSCPEMAFTETLGDGKTVRHKKGEDNTGYRLHLVTYNPGDLNLDDFQRGAVNEIAAAIQGRRTTMDCWCLSPLVATSLKMLRRGKYHPIAPIVFHDDDTGIRRTRRICSLGSDSSDISRAALKFEPRNFEAEEESVARAIQICEAVLAGKGDIQLFMKEVMPLMTPAGVAYSPSVYSEIKRTYENITNPTATLFVANETPFERGQYLSLPAIYMLRQQTWETLYWYIRDHYPAGQNRLESETLSSGEDPNASDANQQRVLHILRLHPAVRARIARVLRQPRSTSDAGETVFRSGNAEFLDLIMRFSGKPRVKLFK